MVSKRDRDDGGGQAGDAVAQEPRGPVKTVEQWAREKKMLDRFHPPDGGMFVRPNEAFALFAAARLHHRWPEGKELTEAEFDEAVASAAAPTFR